MAAPFNLLEIAVYALVLSGPGAVPFECALEGPARVACSHGVTADLAADGRLRLSDGSEVTKDADGGLRFSNGLRVYRGVSGWVHFGPETAVRREGNAAFRFSHGAVCRALRADRVACAHPE